MLYLCITAVVPAGFSLRYIVPCPRFSNISSLFISLLCGRRTASTGWVIFSHFCGLVSPEYSRS